MSQKPCWHWGWRMESGKSDQQGVWTEDTVTWPGLTAARVQMSCGRVIDFEDRVLIRVQESHSSAWVAWHYLHFISLGAKSTRQVELTDPAGELCFPGQGGWELETSERVCHRCHSGRQVSPDRQEVRCIPWGQPVISSCLGSVC